MAANDEKEDIQAEDTEQDAASDKDEGSQKKKRRKHADAGGAGLSKDRNTRVREQAARKMEEAKESAKSRANRIGATGLDAGEMVDDAMARGFAAFTKWIKANRRLIEISVGGIIVAGAGYAAWDWHSNKTREKASAALILATADAAGVVEEKVEEKKDKDPSEDDARLKDMDTRPRFENYKAMRETALRNYRVVADEYGSRGAGILARLGEAGVLLEGRDYDGAIKALNAVLATDLAEADESVRMAAKERLGMALEGKGDEAGAASAYNELAGSTLDDYKNFGLYHQARLSHAKGKKDAAKEKLSKLKERLTAEQSIKSAGADQFLTAQVDALMREIDPSAEPIAPSKSFDGQITPEKLREIQRELEKMRQNPPELPPASAATPPGSAPEAPASAPKLPEKKAPGMPKPTENKSVESPKPPERKAPETPKTPPVPTPAPIPTPAPGGSK